MVCQRLLVVIIISIAALGARSGGAEVLIGVATALTGPVGWEGASSQVGAEQALAELNAKGGVLGERIDMIVVDDACAADQAVVAAKKLIGAGVVAVIGHHCSAASIPASQLYAKAGMLMISPFSTNPKLTEQGFRTVFRAQGRDDRQAEIAGDLLAERFGHQPIAILHDGTVYGQGLAEYTKARLNERGIAEAMFEAIEPGQLDYFDVIRRLRAVGTEVLYYAGYTQEAGLIFRQVRESGYDLQLVAGDAIAAEDFALIAGPAAGGTLMTYGPGPPATAENALLAEQFAAKGYAGSFGHAPFHAYAIVQAWAQAVERASTFAPPAVAEALHTYQFDTVLGRIGFDEKGDVTGYGTYVWHVWQDGEFAPLDAGGAVSASDPDDR
jgi:branched-chain amino acid transport system substrate-binding protein